MCSVLDKHRKLDDTIYPKFKAVTGKYWECSMVSRPGGHQRYTAKKQHT